MDRHLANDCIGSETATEWNAAVARSVQTIRDDIGREYSLRNLAHSALLSPFHFHRVFRLLTASTPARFWAAERMAEAKRLLAYSTISVTDICMRVGYSSLGTFTSQFTRLVGVSPRRFRRLVKRCADEAVHSILLRLRQFVPEPERVQLTGGVTGRAWPGAVAVVGLFPSGIPQGIPAACAFAPVPGLVALGDLADGEYHPLAISFHPALTVAEALTTDDPTRCVIGAAPVPVRIQGGRAVSGAPVSIRLRPRRPIDPPVVLAVPLLLAAEAVGALNGAALVPSQKRR